MVRAPSKVLKSAKIRRVRRLELIRSLIGSSIKFNWISNRIYSFIQCAKLVSLRGTYTIYIVFVVEIVKMKRYIRLYFLYSVIGRLDVTRNYAVIEFFFLFRTKYSNFASILSAFGQWYEFFFGYIWHPTLRKLFPRSRPRTKFLNIIKQLLLEQRKLHVFKVAHTKKSRSSY